MQYASKRGPSARAVFLSLPAHVLTWIARCFVGCRCCLNVSTSPVPPLELHSSTVSLIAPVFRYCFAHFLPKARIPLLSVTSSSRLSSSFPSPELKSFNSKMSNEVRPGRETGVYYLVLGGLSFSLTWRDLLNHARNHNIEVEYAEVFPKIGGWIRILDHATFLRAFGMLSSLRERQLLTL